MTHSVTCLAVSWQYRRGKCQQHVWDWKRKTTWGVFVLCLNSATEGGDRRVGGVESGTRGRGDKIEEVFHSCPAWGPKYVAASSSPRHQPSVLACHYFTSRRAHTLSLGHTYAHLHRHTLPVLPWSTLKCCQHQILKNDRTEKNPTAGVNIMLSHISDLLQ